MLLVRQAHAHEVGLCGVEHCVDVGEALCEVGGGARIRLVPVATHHADEGGVRAAREDSCVLLSPPAGADDRYSKWFAPEVALTGHSTAPCVTTTLPVSPERNAANAASISSTGNVWVITRATRS